VSDAPPGKPDCSVKSDIVFVVDQSGSIQDANPLNGSWDNWQLIKDFINTIIKHSEVSYSATHFGLVTFGNQGVVRFRLDQYTDTAALTQAVLDIQPGQGQTNLYMGLFMARTVVFNENNGARSDVPQIIILITDGFANVNTNMTLPEAATCHRLGIAIYAVGITSSINETQLKLVSSPPHEKGVNYWTTPDFTTLNSVVLNVQNATCQQPKALAPECQILDIAFAFDFPQNISDYTSVKNYIKRFITLYLPIGKTAVHISYATYDYRSSQVQSVFNENSTEDDVKRNLDNIEFIASTPASPSDPTYALEVINGDVFGPWDGRRNSVPGVAVVMVSSALQQKPAVKDAADRLRQRGIAVIAIGMTNDVTAQDLQLISGSRSDVITAESYSDLSTKVQLLAAILCKTGSGIDIVCPAVADVVLLVDESDSIVAPPGRYDNWYTYVLGFLQNLAGSYAIGPDTTHVGVMKFSNATTVGFYLDAFKDRQNLTMAISQLDHDGGMTNIAAALKQARLEMFSPDHGARPNVHHILILITDRGSNIDADQTLAEASLTRAADIEIFTVGMTPGVDMTELSDIASSPPESHSFYADDYSSVNTVLSSLVINHVRLCQGLLHHLQWLPLLWLQLLYQVLQRPRLLQQVPQRPKLLHQVPQRPRLL